MTGALERIDLLILALFAGYAIASGLRARRSASRGLEDYFLAGRTLSGWQAGISMAATQFAADTPLLVTGLIATAGVFSLWRLWIYALAFLLLGFVLAPSWRRARVITDAELTELRYAGRPAAALRALKAIYFGTIFNCVVLAMVLFATKEIAEPFLHWDRWLPGPLFGGVEGVVRAIGVPFAREAPGLADVWLRSTNNLISVGAIVGVTLLYSTTGGLRSVVRTDVAQFGIMLLGTLLYAAWVLDAVGGLSALPERLAAQYAAGGPSGLRVEELLAFTPSRARVVGWEVFAVLGLQWLVQMNADGTGYLAQRCMACRTDRDAQHATVIFVGAQILVRSLLWLPIGLGLLILLPPDPGLTGEALRADRESSYVLGMATLLPAGILGLLLTAMLAALASTVDSHLNWGASYWTNDLYGRFYCRGLRGREPADRTLVWVARASTGGILLLALGVMAQLGSIQSAWQASLLLGAGMGVPLVLRWLWWRMNAWGELAAIGASLLLAPLLLVTTPAEHEAWRLLAVACIGTGAAVVAALATSPESAEQLRAFYERARPAGFWGPVAIATGHAPAQDVRRLLRGLAGVALGGLSVFSLLTALGSWMIGSPPPTWFPLREVWLAGLLVLGLALVPVWWRLGVRGIS